MDEIPVFVFSGFLDSGKSTLIHMTLSKTDITKACTSLMICCEEGEVEYEQEKLEQMHISLEMIEDETDLTKEYLRKLQKKYDPDQVFVEYNGTWKMETLLEMELPKQWTITQILATADASTFDMFLTNMRTMIMSQLQYADIVIFNRCTENTNKGKYRRNIKVLNLKVTIVYWLMDGSIDTRPEEFPINISKDELEISDMDFGLWYLDCVERPERYIGKTVSFLGYVYNPEELIRGIFGIGRFAMVCCEADKKYIGFVCKYKEEDLLPNRSWIKIKAKISGKTIKGEKKAKIVLLPLEIDKCEKPADEFVYFT